MNQLIAKYAMFYPVRLLSGQNINKFLSYVKHVDTMQHDELKKFQIDKVRNILKESYKNIKYYSDLFQKIGLDPSNVRDEKDLLNVPILTKELIRQHSDTLADNRIRRTFKRSTSGSQGTPLTFEKDGGSLACMDAVMYNAYGWHGIDIGAPQARFWGLPLKGKDRRQAILKDMIMNRRRLSAFDLDRKTLRQYYQILTKFKPRYFYGYPSLIHEYIRFADAAGLDLKHLDLKGIIGTGEIVLEHQKKDIENTTNAKFINEYGCTEVGVIGFECPKGNMHLMSHNVFLEVILDDKQVYDTEGEIVVTELNTMTFPFIRYKVGDRGAILSKKCSCGLPHPLISITQGRSDSYIVTPTNKKVYDAVFAYTLKKGITCFKAVQTSVRNIDLFLQINDDYTEDLGRHYISLLKKMIDSTINFNIIQVDNIPCEKSGKLRYFVPLSKSK